MASLPPRAAQPRRIDNPLERRLRSALQPLTAPAAPPPGGRRRASVLLLFDAASDGLPLLFMLRSRELRFHAGQIGFPGGTAEPEDDGVVGTALREAHEEVGLEAHNVDVIGVLSPLVTATSERWLTPVVGMQREPWTVRSDEHEVAEWFRIDLATLLQSPHTIRELERNGVRRAVHFYEAEGRVIWGVSAAILHELMHGMGRDD